MIMYSILSKNPTQFRNVTGISINEFDALFHLFELAWGEIEQERLQQRNTRQRAIGGGRKYKLSLRDRLIAVMVWLHKQLKPSAVATLFDIHTSTAIRNRKRVITALQRIDEHIVTLSEFPAPGSGDSIADHPELSELAEKYRAKPNRKVITLSQIIRREISK